MSMFFDIAAALLALGMAAAWMLTSGEKLPRDWALRTGSTDKLPDVGSTCDRTQRWCCVAFRSTDARLRLLDHHQ
jgi:hypothetical protein